MSEDRSSAVKAVLRLLEARGDLPVIAHAINRVTSLAESEEGSARDLAAAILDDYVMTQKVLRIANSPLYPNALEVSTVSRAIVVLGSKEVQRLALTLKLLEAFPVGSDEGVVKGRLERAFLGGIIAKNVAGGMGSRDAEQAFICGLFHSFGELLVASYLPEKEVEGRALAERHRLPPKSAVRIALGLTYSELGIAVAKRLQFPETIVEAMRTTVRVRSPKKPEAGELQVGLANLGYELSAALLSDLAPGQKDRRVELDRLIKDFEAQFGAINIGLEDLVAGSLADLGAQSRLMELPLASRRLGQQAARAMGTHVDASVGQAVASEEIFARGISEAMRSLAQERSLSEVLVVVLETIHSGLGARGLRRVIFALRDLEEPVLRYRSGLGVELDDAARWFEHPLSGQGDAVSLVMTDGQDRSVRGSELSAALQVRAPADASITLLPIVVAGKVIGLFYVEGDGDRTLEACHHAALKTLRDQVVIAITRSSRAAA